jgi:hypothetical protein
VPARYDQVADGWAQASSLFAPVRRRIGGAPPMRRLGICGARRALAGHQSVRSGGHRLLQDLGLCGISGPVCSGDVMPAGQLARHVQGTVRSMASIPLGALRAWSGTAASSRRYGDRPSSTDVFLAWVYADIAQDRWPNHELLPAPVRRGRTGRRGRWRKDSGRVASRGGSIE